MDRWVRPELVAGLVLAGLVVVLVLVSPLPESPGDAATDGADGTAEPTFRYVCAPVGEDGDAADRERFVTVFYLGSEPIGEDDDVAALYVEVRSSDRRASFDLPVESGNATSLFVADASPSIVVVAETENGSERRLDATTDACERSETVGATSGFAASSSRAVPRHRPRR